MQFKIYQHKKSEKLGLPKIVFHRFVRWVCLFDGWID
jgi:hypothetical protein